MTEPTTGDLFAAGVLTPTPAMIGGRSRVEQCSWCGTLVCVPGRQTAKLGPCPACGGTTWWPQELPVGPFPAAQ